jgi:hypothetical protein
LHGYYVPPDTACRVRPVQKSGKSVLTFNGQNRKKKGKATYLILLSNTILILFDHQKMDL